MCNGDNVLLICTDHWPGQLLGAAGHPTILTPTLDELCENGVRFSRAYAECPVCIPARRTLMTGTSPRTHGDRVFQATLTMPQLPTLAEVFRDAGYQANAVGKIHVFPQRNRIGFNDVILHEEGRTQFGVMDDYDIFLGDKGYPGQQFAHGMSNNQYVSRPWHLPEELHPIEWATAQMERVIRRRDPTRPAFWYLSFSHPHPPLVPLAEYMAMYTGTDDDPPIGDWAEDTATLPFKLREVSRVGERLSPAGRRAARRAFYALCTQIDHQIRRVIGTLREEGLLDRTHILFISDHGDMLGTHRLWAKRSFYEGSAAVPMIMCNPPGRRRANPGTVDDRLVGLQDVMPTLLDLCGIPVPKSVEGVSAVGSVVRETLYGEEGEGIRATRMVHDGRYKLIYYSSGNVTQLFDLDSDPLECHNLSSRPEHATTVRRLTEELVARLYGSDRAWLCDGSLIGEQEPLEPMDPVPGLYGQRGSHWPPPPATGADLADHR